VAQAGGQLGGGGQARCGEELFLGAAQFL